MALNFGGMKDIFERTANDGQVLKARGQKQIPEDDDDTQTKEFWAPISGSKDNQEGFFGDFLGAELTQDLEGGVTCKIPHDFTSITSAELIIINDTTNATTNIDVYSDYAAEGEAYTTHS